MLAAKCGYLPAHLILSIMFRTLCVALILTFTTAACSQRVYSAKELVPEALTRHKLVAILPFEVKLDRIRMQDITYAGTGMPSETTIEQHRKNWEEKQLSQRREVAYQLQQELLNQLVARQVKHPY